MKSQYNVMFSTTANKEKVCAYCNKHRKNMTVKQVYRKECLMKHCRHLVKYEHRFWEDRENRKTLRQERKKRIESFFEKTPTETA